MRLIISRLITCKGKFIFNIMYSTTYTANHQNIRRAPSRRVVIQSLEITPVIKKLLLIAFVVNIALVGVIYTTLFMFPQEKFSSTNTLLHEVNVGPATESFIKELKTNSLKPVPTTLVNRKHLTVVGTTISLGGDNIQVFEYEDSKTARSEAGVLIKEYEYSMKESTLPEKSVHIYAKDKLLVFYMGSNQAIMESITKNTYQSVEGISLYANDEFSAVSRDGSYYK